MGALIHLAAPAPAGADASRVYYAVGRSLTAADLALQDRYIEARLLGLAPAAWGAITGLGVAPARYDSPDGTTGLAAVTIGTGTGIGRDGRLVRVSAPISLAWSDLVTAVNAAGTLADGAYLLVVRSVEFDGLEGPPPDPCARGTADPLLDIQQVSFVEVWLSAPIGALPAATSPAALALALNTLVGGLTAETLAAAVGSGLPLALVLVRNSRAILLSQAAGRLVAAPSGVAALLLAQTREAFAMVLAEPGADPAAAAWQVAVRARFRLLPGAGELPLGLLAAPDAVTASCPFFPPGTGVTLEAIRASQASNLMAEALTRPPLDLAAGTAQAVTLALAVPDAAWTPDLLDIPRGDPVLAADLHLAYARARVAQVAVREAWIALYGGMGAIAAADPQAIGFLVGADAAAQNLGYLLTNKSLTPADFVTAANAAAAPGDLLGWIAARIATLATLQATAAPPPAAVPTTDAATAAQLLAALGYQLLDPEPPPADPAITPHAPVASDTLLAPLVPALPANSGFADWTAAITAVAPDPALLQPLIDAGIVDPGADAATQAGAIAALLALPARGDARNDDTQPGALAQLAVLQLFYAVLGRVTRALEYALEAHGRLIALQRLHLDIMSTYVSALAGGVPSDGSGLSFTRIIPFFTLTPSAAGTTGTTTAAPSPSPTPAGTAATTRAAGVQMMATRSYAAVRMTTAPAATAAPSRPLAASVIKAAPPAGAAAAAPTLSRVGSVLGSTADIARNVAIDAGALSQAPPFSYQPVLYGTAAHITPGATLLQTANDGLSKLRGLMAQAPIGIAATPGPTPSASATAGLDDETAAYSGILEANRGLLGDMTLVENQAIALEAGYLQLRDRTDALGTRIGQLTDALAAARDALRAAQVAAAQSSGDYAAAQQLVLEEVARVAAATQARSAAIAAATGLFYVRELQTVVACGLPPALALTTDTPADLVPGCAADHPGPPAAIQPFLDQLLEVPLADWSALQGGWSDLPDNAGLLRLGALRTARVANWTASSAFGAGAAAADLAALASNAQGVFDPVFRSTISIGPSLALTQQAAFAVFALPDIVALPPSPLRGNTEALRARLESAAGCLFEALSALPPSARFAWASEARAGTLPPLGFAQWPIPASLGTAGTATLRRLAALVTWMAAQLHDGSSAAAQTALGNLVAAAVIAAAYGDPDDAVTGSVASTGGVPRPGVPIRVVLNRTAPIGTVLHLLDANQSVVGTLRVTDHDALGTTATVVTSAASTAPTSGWTVAVPGSRAPWLPA